ncbi:MULTISPECIES: ribbon-helix-helix domain-containing protein [unclassified Ochrobactrum]|uniref:ribbon-helix-helix domain-containing protein n=1 Tax=unclassified Ochrobactrum TaxID=239106 RepID=UPI000DD8070C|nr:ribbon-helix-helix domain-containing protein [Ochrobactrum sp. 3-3]MBQ0708723.1 ribbon-helix-helix domain-containing protein [Ochrobactrum sp. AP1BH01-1]
MTVSGRLRKHSVSIRGHATSYTLEDAFFELIEEIAAARELSVAALIAEIDSRRDRSINLSSALRLHVLNWLKSRTGMKTEA